MGEGLLQKQLERLAGFCAHPHQHAHMETQVRTLILFAFCCDEGRYKFNWPLCPWLCDHSMRSFICFVDTHPLLGKHEVRHTDLDVSNWRANLQTVETGRVPAEGDPEEESLHQGQHAYYYSANFAEAAHKR